MIAAAGVDIMVAAMDAASDEERAWLRAAEQGDPNVSFEGVRRMMLDALHRRLVAGEWMATAYLTEDATVRELVPIRWWRDMWLLSDGTARGSGREVTNLKILIGATATPSPTARRRSKSHPPKAGVQKVQTLPETRKIVREHLAGFHFPPGEKPSYRACWRALGHRVRIKLMTAALDEIFKP